MSLTIYKVTLPDGEFYTTTREPDLARIPAESRPRVDVLVTEVQRAEATVDATGRVLDQVAEALAPELAEGQRTLPHVLALIRGLRHRVENLEDAKQRLELTQGRAHAAFSKAGVDQGPLDRRAEAMASRIEELQAVERLRVAYDCKKPHEGDVVEGYVLKRVHWDEASGRRDTMG